jgi:hypothetical protein
MVKITKFDNNLSYTFTCNVLSIKNNGVSEALITFQSSGDTLSVQRGQIIYVFNSNTLVTDTIDVVFTTIGTNNEIEVIQTDYSSSAVNETDSLTRTEERNVYVNIVPEQGLNRYDISKYNQGTSAFGFSNGAINIQGVYSLEDTVAAIQTKNIAPNIEGSVYGGWIDLSKYEFLNGAEISFGLGILSQTPNYEVEEGIYFELSNSYERIALRSLAIGLYYLENRSNWYDSLDGSGPSGVSYTFGVDKGIFYFEYIYSGNKVNVYLSFAGQEILVQTINCIKPLFNNPRQHIFVRAKAPIEDSSFDINFNGCSIYNCSNSQVPRVLGCSSATFTLDSEKYTTGFLSGYLGMGFKRLQTGAGYRFVRLKDFQVVSEDNHAFSLLLVINPTITNTNTPPNLLAWTYPFGSFGTQEPMAFAANYDGKFEITDYELCVHISQHIQHSELVSVVNQFLGNEINGNPQTIAIMILPSTNNMKFRVTANVEEI